jgi:general secretion pathway protein G
MQLNDVAAARRRAAGFTLIEIMVVVVILGILAALVLPNVMGRIGQAQTTKVKADIQNYETALNLFKLDNFKYPTTDQGLEALVRQPADPSIRNWKEGGYIRSLKKDPWGNNYQYIYPGTHGTEYDLFTLGADNQPGGDGDNADIGNWALD